MSSDMCILLLEIMGWDSRRRTQHRPSVRGCECLTPCWTCRLQACSRGEPSALRRELINQQVVYARLHTVSADWVFMRLRSCMDRDVMEKIFQAQIRYVRWPLYRYAGGCAESNDDSGIQVSAMYFSGNLLKEVCWWARPCLGNVPLCIFSADCDVKRQTLCCGKHDNQLIVVHLTSLQCVLKICLFSALRSVSLPWETCCLAPFICASAVSLRHHNRWDLPPSPAASTDTTRAERNTWNHTVGLPTQWSATEAD